MKACQIYMRFQKITCLLFLLLIFSACPALAGDDLNVDVSASQSSYQQGEKVLVTAQVSYRDGTLVRQLEDSDIDLKDSRGNKVVEGSFQKVQDGVFAFEYQLSSSASLGAWSAKVDIGSDEADREGEWEEEVNNLFQVVQSTPEEEEILSISLSSETDRKSYQVGDTISVFAQALYSNGDIIDDIKRKVVVLKDATGTRVHRGSLIEGNNGNFIYSYQIPAGFELGSWQLIVRIIDEEDLKAVSKLVLNVSDNDGEPPVDPNNVDNDNDGYSENQGDCNDSSAAVHPGASEILYNGIDENCNGMADDVVDADSDGYTSNVDCNDTNASINPGAVEICGDGVDQDCSGADLVCPVDPNDIDDDSDGFTENQGDCNDSSPAINPDAVEICGDGIDQDCSSADLECPTDPNDIDDDLDGFTENQGDCDDSSANINPDAEEICGDGVDQDCSGDDLECPIDSHDIDDDTDGFTENQGDCNDSDATINPGAEEICGDGIDQDCSGADLACPIDPLDVDDDSDGYTENEGDCNDMESSINPGAEEILSNGIDENCNGMADDEPVYSDNHFNNPDCLLCHTADATEVHGSVHYQWQGDTPYMTNGGSPQGKLTGAVNSYCINIMGNWNGCSSCHVGKGAMPEPVATQAQLENIDCAKCHSEPGVLPTRTECLSCHATAGGGDAVKRGDLALATGNTTDRNYDVHMATTGGNLQCRSCHTTQDHRIAGKGSDLRPTDLDVQVECSNCHGSSPHSSGTINRHTARVACQTCHIPIYAKDAADTSASEATETHRTWLSTHATAPPFHPAADKANDLIPEYRFWNGDSNNYLLGDVAQLDPATGAYPTSRPEGGINNTGSKLFPFKYKTAEQPMVSGSKQLIALDTSVFFMSADAETATSSGLANMGLSENTPYEWVMTDTYQLLNHQVSPKEQVLQCSDCHQNTAQMDLPGELGYNLKGSMSSVCSQCHGYENSKGFDWDHDKHVTDKGYDCSRCHNFSRPERGLR